MGDRFDTDGWRARMTPDLVSDLVQIELAQVLGAGPDRMMVTPIEWTTDGRMVVRQDPAAVSVESSSLWLPRGAVAAICEHADPAAVARAEVRRLEETLRVEQARVDAVLAGVTR